MTVQIGSKIASTPSNLYKSSRLVVHGRILSPLALPQALGLAPARGLTKEALLLVKGEVVGVVEEGRDVQLLLEGVHDHYGVGLERLAVHYVELLRWVVGEPPVDVVGIVARVQAPEGMVIKLSENV